jgi:hypothetical protein
MNAHRTRLVAAACVGVIAATAIVLAAAAVGNDRQLSREEQAERSRQAFDWTIGRARVLVAFRRVADKRESFLAELEQGNTVEAGARAGTIRLELARIDRRWAALPRAPFPDLRLVDRSYARALRLAAGAFADYEAALSANAASGAPLGDDERAQALLDRGDVKWGRMETIVANQSDRLLELNEKYAPPPGGS